MELIIVILGLLVLVFPIYVLTQLSQLRRELNQLKQSMKIGGAAPNPKPSIYGESYNAALQTLQSKPTTPTPTPEVSHLAVGLRPQPTITPAAVLRTTPDQGFDLIAWFQKDLLVKVGALLLLMGFGWFLSFAFSNGLIGPRGQIALGILAGIIFMVVGVWRLSRSVHQAGIFVVLGSGIVLMTVFSARLIYDFFTPTTALITMFMSIALVAFVAVRAKSQNIAIVGLLMGAAVPYLTYTPEPSTIGLFTYLAVLVLGSVWVMFQIKSEWLLFVALSIVFLFSAPYMEYGTGEDSMIVLLSSFGFTLLFFLGNLVTFVRRQGKVMHSIHLLTAAGTGLYLATSIYTMAPESWHAFLFAVWMVVFAGGAFVVFMFAKDRVPFYVYGAVSIGLLGAATASLLDGYALTIALIAEITAVISLATLFIKEQKIAEGLCFLFALPILLSINNIIAPNWESGFLHSDFFVLTSLLLGLAFVASLMQTQYRRGAFRATPTPQSLAGFAGGYGVVLVWLITHSVLPDDTATLFSLVLYTISGMALYIRGVTIASSQMKIWGGVLIGLVVGRLLLIDVWEMDIIGRIITFFVIGLLLISTAFIRKFNQS